MNTLELGRLYNSHDKSVFKGAVYLCHGFEFVQKHHFKVMIKRSPFERFSGLYLCDASRQLHNENWNLSQCT